MHRRWLSIFLGLRTKWKELQSSHCADLVSCLLMRAGGSEGWLCYGRWKMQVFLECSAGINCDLLGPEPGWKRHWEREALGSHPDGAVLTDAVGHPGLVGVGDGTLYPLETLVPQHLPLPRPGRGFLMETPV